MGGSAEFTLIVCSESFWGQFISVRKDNIKMDYGEMGLDLVAWNDVAQVSIRGQAYEGEPE
jgi:hypothetical protein